MASLFDVFGRLLLDDGGKQFVADSAKVGTRAGEAVEKSMGKRVREGLSTALKVGLGAGAGGAVGAFAASTAQVGDAVALLGARTGKTREEMAGYEDRMRAIHSQNFGRDFADIADVLSQVETGLHLAGEEADAFTKGAITLRDVFGKEVNETLRAARPLMENFGLTGEQSLDLITAGLQAGGENAEDLLDTFQEYSGNFRDMGFSAQEFLDMLVAGLENGARNTDLIADAVKEFDIRIRDGSATTSEALQRLGIDATKFTADLGSGAMTGAQAMELINTKLRAVGDTTAQEQIGVGLYGTKWEDVGAQAILALDNSEGAVKDLGVTVDGASKQMQDAIAGGPTAAWQGFIRSVFGGLNEILAAVPGLEQALTPLAVIFGPALSAKIGAGLGAAAGLLTKGIPNIFKGLPGVLAGAIVGKNAFAGPLEEGLETGINQAMSGGRVSGAAGKLGKFMGSTLGKAASVAFAGVLVFEAIETFNRVHAEIDAQRAALLAQNKEFMGVATTEQLKAAREGVAQQAAELGNMDLGEMLFGQSAAKLIGRKTAEQLVAELDAEIAARSGAVANATAGMGPAINDGLERAAVTAQVGAKAIPLAISKVVSSSIGNMGANWSKVARAQANRAGAAVAEGINKARSEVDASWDALLLGLKNAMTPTKERAKLLGYLASTELAKGLKSGDPAVRAQAAATKQVILDRLAVLGANAKNIGKDGMEALRKGMKSKDADIRLASTAIYNAANSKIKTLPAKATTYGQNVGYHFASGMTAPAVIHAIETAADRISRIVAGHLRLDSPAEEGAMSKLGGPEGWGERVGMFFSKGLAATLPDLSGLGHWEAPQLADAVSRPRPGAPTWATGDSVASTVVNNYYEVVANVEGKPEVADPIALAREMSRVARRGELRPRAALMPRRQLRTATA